MPKYLMEATYGVEGVKGLAKEGGSSRKKTIESLVQGMGGKLESFYYSFGHSDVYLIVDLPDAASAVAISLAVNQSGAVQLKTHVLLSTEEMDQAGKMSVAYRAPGK